jgi:hypothetical protein
LQFYNQAHESYCCIYQYIFNFYHWTVMYCQIKRTDGHGETSIPPYNLVAGGIKNPTNTILIGLLFMYWKHLITNISLFFLQTVVVLVWWSLNNRVFFLRRLEFQCQISNFPAISWWEQVNFQRDDDCQLCTRPTRIVGFFIVLAYWDNSLRIDILPYLDTLSPIPCQPVFALSP